MFLSNEGMGEGSVWIMEYVPGTRLSWTLLSLFFLMPHMQQLSTIQGDSSSGQSLCHDKVWRATVSNWAPRQFDSWSQIYGQIYLSGHFSISTALRCWIQADNTVKEIRNGFVARLCSTLVQGGTFSCMAHNHLVVGHTHEDVDSVFSLVTSALSSTPSLMTPRDVENTITQKLEPIFKKNSMVFGIEFVDTVLYKLFHLVSFFVQPTSEFYKLFRG